MTKAIECHYPGKTYNDLDPRTQSSDNTATERWSTAASLVTGPSSVENRQEARSEGGSLLDTAVLISNPELADLGGEYLGWDDPELDFADFLNPQLNDEPVQYSSLGPSFLQRQSMPSVDQGIQMRKPFSSLNTSIPTSPTYTIRSLILRPRLKTGTQRTIKLILHTLKSYPLMMLRHNTLPPFIHPYPIFFDVENSHMEPLRNCISLVHMISSRVQGSRKLFWRNVRLECERLLEEVS
jgi:hypothetical protein